MAKKDTSTRFFCFFFVLFFFFVFFFLFFLSQIRIFSSEIPQCLHTLIPYTLSL